MRGLYKVFHLVGLILLCSSCSSGEGLFAASPVKELTALPTPTATQIELVRPTSSFPGIITGVEQKEGQLIAIQDEICVQVDENWLWKPGNFWEGFENSPQVQIYVNDVPIKTPRRYITGPLITAFDKEGKITGTHGFSVETCVQLSTLSVKQNNVMKIEVAYQGKILLSDSWSFIVPTQK